MKRAATHAIVLTLMLLATIGTGAANLLVSPDAARLAKARQWADSVMRTLTPQERLEQLIITRIDVKGDKAGCDAMRKLVSNNHLGGILLGKGTLYDYARLVNAAQEAARVPLLITLDGEWGLAMRVTDAPRFPFNMTLGAITDPRLLYDYGREVGRECRAIGINVDFAPVLDINSNPNNPVIGTRSFGENRQRVATLGLAYSQGLESMGVLSVAKHFPGHGNTAVDSHKSLPRLTAKRAELDTLELFPFREYIAKNLGGVMVGHLSVPALDSKGTPASLSKKITTNLLKKELGFSGLVFTDALAMKGASDRHNNCVEAFLAGADLLLQPANLSTDLHALQQALKSGRIKQSEIDERCRKLLISKYLLGLSSFTPVNTATIREVIASPTAAAINQRLADASITALRNDAGLLPISDLGHKRVAVALIGEKKDCLFASYCAKYAPIDLVSVNGSTITDVQLEQLRKADIVVTAIFSDSDWAVKSYSRLQQLSSTIGVFFINPYKMGRFKPAITEASTLLVAYQNLPDLQRAAAEGVFGGISVTGRFPVNVEGVADVGAGVNLPKVRLGFSTPLAQGMNPDVQQVVDSIASEALRQEAFTGCQIVAVRNGEIVIDSAYGRIDNDSTSAPVTPSTLFDLASVSKTHSTLLGLMKSVDEGLVRLDDRIGNHIPAIDSTAMGDISVEQLLFHESGIPASINIYRVAFDPMTYQGPLLSSKEKEPYTIRVAPNLYGNSEARLRMECYSPRRDNFFQYQVAEGIYTSQDGIDSVMTRVYKSPLHAPTYEYSCLNFILLKQLQEEATGVDMDQWVDTEIYGPLGTFNTTFLPLQRFDKSQIAATETDNFLRRSKLHGYVHDETAAFSGGVQGNAGLFSTAGDVAKICQMLLNGGSYGGEQLLSDSTTRMFTTRLSASGRRGLGFDLLRHNPAMASPKASPGTYGHTGFTGTCYWIDPDKQLIIVFLSNRVNPTRENAAWTRLNPRGAVIRAIYDSLDSTKEVM